ncbi:MAG: adenylate kinase [Planctomycetota bacterium]
MNAILLGPPGAGKGTQAERLCRSEALLHLSTGDLLRAAVAQGTDLGREATAFLDRGALVPDALVLALLEQPLAGRAAGEGFLLDGFPRNVSQAKALDEVLGEDALDHVIHLQLDDEEILRRLLERGRPDDSEEVVRNRLVVYRAETEPLVRYYADRGLLRAVDARGSIDEVEERVHSAIGAASGPVRA